MGPADVAYALGALEPGSHQFRCSVHPTMTGIIEVKWPAATDGGETVDFYPWIVLLHVVSAFVFILAHGVSAFVPFKVRDEPDRARISALLDLSGSSLNLSFVGLGLAVVSGIVAAIIGGHFSQFWPWAAIGVLIVVSGLMTPMATYPLTAIRRAVGQPNRDDRKKGIVPEPLTDAQIATLRAGLRPELAAVVGFVGLVVLIWLMQTKPF